MDLYLLDLTTGTTTLVTRSFRPPFEGGDADTFTKPFVTDTGRVLFSSQASNLVPADFNFEGFPMFDVFLYLP
ncbi:MAG TPA: hypothetical protein VF789_07040 [Thermoanaerobaculia bacterium]